MILILNFKTYRESLGANAIALAEAAYKFSQNYDGRVIICPQFVDLENVISKFPPTNNFEVWAQHVDFQKGDKQTGFIIADTLKALGVKGALLNHAEHKIESIENYSDISGTLEICYCVNDLLELSLMVHKNPDFKPLFIAYETPSLISGDLSVSSTHGRDIEEIVDKFPAYNILVGAGIKTADDVRLAEKYGAKGILMASGFVFSPNKEDYLKDLVSYKI